MERKVIDLTACITRGTFIKIADKEYEIRFSYSALKSLEEQYGNVGMALDSLLSNEKKYENVLNFLYAACGEKYNLKKTDIEEWITLSTIEILRNVIYDAIMGAFGQGNGEEQTQGEA